jgi:hypothetical protein
MNFFATINFDIRPKIKAPGNFPGLLQVRVKQ